MTCYIFGAIGFGVIQKVRSFGTSNFLPSSPILVCPCSFYMYPFPSTYIRFCELPSPIWKKVRDIYEFSNEKSETEKRKSLFFYKLNLNVQYFYTVIYVMTIWKYLQVHKKTLNEKKNEKKSTPL